MKTFVVNLDKDTARWASVSAQLRRADVEFERLPGVLGRDLTAAERAEHYDPVKASWRQARALTPAEIGVALSHLRVYREISQRKLDRALVLEDDVTLPDRLAPLLDGLAAEMPADKPVVCLLSPAEAQQGATSRPLGDGYALMRYAHGYFASSYALTRRAAEILLAKLHPVGDVADCWERLARTGDLDFRVVEPAAITQNQEDFGSSTTEDIRTAFGASSLTRLAYMARRLRNIALSGFAEAVWRAQIRPVDPNARHPIDTLRR